MKGDYIKKYKYLRDHMGEIKSEVFDIKRKQADLKMSLKRALKKFKVKKLLDSISDKNDK